MHVLIVCSYKYTIFSYCLHQKNEKRHFEDDEEDQQVAALKLLKSQAEERVAMLTEEDAEVKVVLSPSLIVQSFLPTVNSRF